MDIFHYIRHAESDCNKNSSHLVGGRASLTPLSPEGVLQAQKLGKRFVLENVKIDRWVASSALRARNTALIVMREMGIPDPEKTLLIASTIEEISQGDWEGKPREECYTEECMRQIREDNWNFKAPNGESQREVEERMLAHRATLLENGQDMVTAVFTHGYAIKCMMRGMYDWNKKMTHTTDMHNTGITTLYYKSGQWGVTRTNDHAHLTLL